MWDNYLRDTVGCKTILCDIHSNDHNLWALLNNNGVLEFSLLIPFQLMVLYIYLIHHSTLELWVVEKKCQIWDYNPKILHCLRINIILKPKLLISSFSEAMILRYSSFKLVPNFETKLLKKYLQTWLDGKVTMLFLFSV